MFLEVFIFSVHFNKTNFRGPVKYLFIYLFLSRVTANNAKKQKPPKAKAKAKATEVKKDLTNIRVIQRRMAYVIGLPLSLADENVWTY